MEILDLVKDKVISLFKKVEIKPPEYTKHPYYCERCGAVYSYEDAYNRGYVCSCGGGIISGGEPGKQWRCPRCGQANPYYVKDCLNCGWSRPLKRVESLKEKFKRRPTEGEYRPELGGVEKRKGPIGRWLERRKTKEGRYRPELGGVPPKGRPVKRYKEEFVSVPKPSISFKLAVGAIGKTEEQIKEMSEKYPEAVGYAGWRLKRAEEMKDERPRRAWGNTLLARGALKYPKIASYVQVSIKPRIIEVALSWIGGIIAVSFGLLWLGVGLFLLGFYITLPSEGEIMAKAEEEYWERMERAKEKGKKKVESKEEKEKRLAKESKEAMKKAEKGIEEMGGIPMEEIKEEKRRETQGM